MSDLSEALAMLEQVFGESGLGSGGPSGGGGGPSFMGVNTVTAGPAPGMSWGPIGSFPFRTLVATAVWKAAQKLLPCNKDATVDEIIRLSMIDAKVFSQDLSGEDLKLLEMAIGWLISTKPPKPAESKP